MGPAAAVLLPGFALVGSWEEAPQEKRRETTPAPKAMKDVVSSKPPFYCQLKAL